MSRAALRLEGLSVPRAGRTVVRDVSLEIPQGEVTALLYSYSPAQILGGHLTLFRTLMVFGGIGTILTAGYFLWTVQRVNLGVVPERWQQAGLRDLMATEWVSWGPLIAGIVVLGLVPTLVFGVTNDAVLPIVHLFGGS